MTGKFINRWNIWYLLIILKLGMPSESLLE